MTANRPGLRVLALSLAALLVPALVHAQQSKVEISLFAGNHFATDNAARQLPDRPAQRRPSLASGARVTLWATDALNVEFTGGYSSARVLVTAASGSRFARSTDVLFGSAKLAYSLLPSTSSFGLLLSGGIATLRADKTVADASMSDSRFGGVGGLGLRVPIGSSKIAVRGDAEGFVYSADYGLGKKTAFDVMLTAGLVIGF
jgi:hypothetical protein